MFNFIKKKRIQYLTEKLKSLRQARSHMQPSEIDIVNEVKMYYQLAKIYESLRYDSRFPHAEIYAAESYRSAALLGDANACYLFAAQLIEKGKFWQNLSNSIFGCKAHEKYAADHFEEAFTYLHEAIKSKHALAKRLHGLAIINGWGVKPNLEQGFELVIESIEQEGAWDKATQIFEEIGLNRPEFFAYLSKRKKGT